MAWTKWKPAPFRRWLYEALIGRSRNTPFALRPMGRIFSRNFSKNWKKTKNDWPLIAITELRSRVSHDEYLDLSYSVFFPSFLQWSGAEYRLLRFPLLLSQTPRLRWFYLNDGTHQRVLRDGYDRNHLGSPLWRSLVHWSHPFCA